MFLNRMPRYEVLSGDAMGTLERGWERLAREVGVRFDHPSALELFREAGQTVDDEGVVRFDPGFLRAQVAMAPTRFALRARNPARDLDIGGDAMVFARRQRTAVRAHRRRAPRRAPWTTPSGCCS